MLYRCRVWQAFAFWLFAARFAIYSFCDPARLPRGRTQPLFEKKNTHRALQEAVLAYSSSLSRLLNMLGVSDVMMFVSGKNDSSPALATVECFSPLHGEVGSGSVSIVGA